MMAFAKSNFLNYRTLSTAIPKVFKHIDGFQYSLCQKEDFPEALDLRYNHFQKEETLLLGNGGHRERTDLLDRLGTELLSKGCSIKVIDPQNEKMVGLLMGSIKDRRDLCVIGPIEHLDNYVKEFGSVTGAVMYLYDLYGNPRFIFEKHPDSQRYLDMKNVMVHQSYRNCGIAQELLRLGATTARDEWGCDGASGMFVTEPMSRLTSKQDFVPYKRVKLDNFCVDGKLLFPLAREATVSFVFKRLNN